MEHTRVAIIERGEGLQFAATLAVEWVEIVQFW
jgi:hypothetical protein